MSNLYIDDFDRISNVKDAPELKNIFSVPRGHWICKSQKNLSNSVSRFLKRCGHNVPILVIYNAPNRDFGGHSRGGCQNHEQYLEFICDIAYGLNQHDAIIIFEPDLLPLSFGISDGCLQTNIQLIEDSLRILSKTHCKTYIDIGHPRWLNFDDASRILSSINADFKGFSINVSNFIPLDECIVYGQLISQSIRKSFVIDTSRNGVDTFDSSNVFNPAGRKLGIPSTLTTGLINVDGFLWIKTPGESDGKVNSKYAAGVFDKNYALSLLPK